ncbi:FAS-associated factor 2-like isoform X2 [Ruditapes philippinarum]|uniref:FAS-associated factor 2-like isoform X2 n=1 Tax=Ruditapes philippinarum TaxID=129788 RepID=UPI00295B448A|nr:FAS-associated factor 2-like isoform X2 [Ruditapes philippinarum]
MAEAEDLTPDQTEKLIQFQDLTGIEEIDRCRQTLERHNWDIEVAVQDTFNEQEGRQSVFNEPPEEPRTPPMNLEPTDQRIFTVQAQQPQGIVQWGYYIITLPFRFVYTTLLDIIRFAFQILRPDPRRNVTDPVGDVVRFLQTYNEKYGENHPVFYQGSYSQALNDAKTELRFLLVYLHGMDHQDSDRFCRNTLGNEDVVNFINTSMLFWACDTNSPEGYRVSQALRENTYPFLALIVLRQNKMTVVARIEGPIEGEELIHRLRAIMGENEASLVAARADRDERSFNQSLRQQQDEAYLESLRQDQEKERKKREERELIEAEEAKQRQKIEAHKQMLQERENRKEELKNEIPPEPENGHAESVRVVLKLPNGTRIERRFLKSQSLKYLYYFTFCHEDCPDDFHIVTNFPRKTLPCEPTIEYPEPITFEEAGLGKNEMLFVQDNES